MSCLLQKMAHSTPHITVVVASLGRSEALFRLLRRLEIQTRAPKQVILSLESEADCPNLEHFSLPVIVTYGPRGSSAQRNRAIDRLGPEVDLIVIIDDDYVPSQFFLEGVARSFIAFPQVSGLGGLLLADGAMSEGVPFDQAVEIIEAHEGTHDMYASPRLISGMAGVYGCNMVFRRDHIGKVRFDEAVPLYGWLEDTDFGARLPGPFLYTDGFFGVHCSVKSGRERKGNRFGYSQIANPIYFWRKGTLPLKRMVLLVLRPLAANLIKALHPEPWIDRKGRLFGNFAAFADLARGRMAPDRILQL